MRRNGPGRHLIFAIVALLLAAIAGAGWYGRHAILMGVAHILVAEAPPVPAEVMVVSIASAKEAALEAAALYQQQISARIMLFTWASEATDNMVRQLGIAYPSPTELARMILEQSGVPANVIEVLPDLVDGTETEIAAVARFTRQRMPASLLFITARSHTARARWLLRRGVSSTSCLYVTSSRFDHFAVESWWQTRSQSRAVMSEYLRWGNTLLLGDAWSRRFQSPQKYTEINTGLAFD
jgi:uncharacterized SAM-binding protein YcdF (DUF218 family)